MKNRFVVLIAATCCLLGWFAGCSSNSVTQSSKNSSDPSLESSLENSSQSSSQSAQQPSEGLVEISAPYAEADLQSVVFTDTAKALTLDVSENQHLRSLLLSAKYYQEETLSLSSSSSTENENSAESAKYVLSLQSCDIQIFSANEVCFITADGEGQNKQNAVAADEKFAYLETLLDGDEQAIGDYTAEQTLEVKNAENASGEITDKAAFLGDLNKVRVVKLQNKAHYQIGEKTYVLKIGNDQIEVYQKYITVNGDLYAIYQGNFNFLKNLDFWLPWL
ncbi:MAG: hypothetical protein IJX87_00150 [Clostridia bacterium]|nr:hypothetical protein [Clostridia bacterium]